jgi:hypothetical protein
VNLFEVSETHVDQRGLVKGFEIVSKNDDFLDLGKVFNFLKNFFHFLQTQQSVGAGVTILASGFESAVLFIKLGKHPHSLTENVPEHFVGLDNLIEVIFLCVGNVHFCDNFRGQRRPCEMVDHCSNVFYKAKIGNKYTSFKDRVKFMLNYKNESKSDPKIA